jgi:pyridoxine 4-dehydrogenase
MAFVSAGTPTDAGAAGTFLLGGELPLNRMGYGAMQLPGPGVWGPPADRDRARAVVRRAVELGVNHIDTSDYYGPHVANEILRESLFPYPDNMVLVTKVGAKRSPDGAWPSALRPADLRQAVLDNLHRLNLEQLSCVNLRIVEEAGGLTPEDSIEEPFTTMAQLQQEGLVRHLGVSNVSLAQLDEALTIASVACVQNEYNIIRRRHEPVLERCEAEGIAFMPFFPLGTFTLLHEREPGADAKVPLAVKLTGQALSSIAERLDATAYQVALAWSLHRSPNICCIPGTSSIEHLEENIAAAALKLSDEDMSQLDSLRTDGY